MLAASATRADGAEELMAEELIAEKLQQAARWPAACWPAGAALAGGAAGDWRRQASCSAALARLPLVVRLVALRGGEGEEKKK